MLLTLIQQLLDTLRYCVRRGGTGVQKPYGAVMSPHAFLTAPHPCLINYSRAGLEGHFYSASATWVVWGQGRGLTFTGSLKSVWDTQALVSKQQKPPKTKTERHALGSFVISFLWGSACSLIAGNFHTSTKLFPYLALSLNSFLRWQVPGNPE